MKKKITLAAFTAAALLAASVRAASDLEPAIARGAKFLLSHQAEDGHFSDPHMPALTALPLCEKRIRDPRSRHIELE